MLAEHSLEAGLSKAPSSPQDLGFFLLEMGLMTQASSSH